MRNAKLGSTMLVLTLAVASTAAATGRLRGGLAGDSATGRAGVVTVPSSVSAPAVSLPELPAWAGLGIDTAEMDYYWVGSDGVVSYGFAPRPGLSPEPSSWPRPAVSVAYLFLARNAAVLGIEQDPADFRLAASDTLCDGSTLVVLEQTVGGIPIEGSALKLAVRDETVVRMDASFVGDVAGLLPCAPQAVPGTELRVVVSTSGSIVVATTIEQVGNGQTQVETYRDACTSAVLGWTVHVKN